MVEVRGGGRRLGPGREGIRGAAERHLSDVILDLRSLDHGAHAAQLTSVAIGSAHPECRAARLLLPPRPCSSLALQLKLWWNRQRVMK